MHILSLETSHLPGSVELSQEHGGQYASRASRTLPSRQSTAQHFAPTIREMLQEASLRPSEIGLVAVDVGPGSFTGLRIAVTFAKVFAYATGADVLGISSIDVLAQQGASATEGRLWTVVDAHRGQVFAACYEVGGDRPLREAITAEMLPIDRWTGQLEPHDVITGPIVERLLPRLPTGVTAAPSALGFPTAEVLGRIAWQRWRAGERGDIWQLSPNYIRKSAAEERLDTPSS